MRSHWTVALVGWFLFMTWLSHQSGPKTAEESRALARELQPLLPGRDPEAINCLLRKAAHVLVFAVLAILASGAAVAPGTSAPPAWVYGLLVVWCLGRRSHQAAGTRTAFLLAGRGPQRGRCGAGRPAQDGAVVQNMNNPRDQGPGGYIL